MATEKKVVYTATADFSFRLNRRNYAAKAGEVWTCPEDMTEVPAEPDAKGLRFQYSTWIKTVNEEKGTENEEEFPHYMILPLTKS